VNSSIKKRSGSLSATNRHITGNTNETGGHAAMKLSQAFDTFMLYKRASGVSENTIANYKKTWQKLRLYFHADPEFQSITLEDWLHFLAWVPDEFDLAPKSVANIHTDLSSLYTWGTG
jgi:site-specific recombinase XerD